MAIDQWWWPLQPFQCEWWGFSRSPPPRLHAGDYADMCTADHTHFDVCDDKLIRMRTRVRSCNLIFVSLSIFHRLHGFVSYVWASQWISVCSPYTHGDQGVVAGWVPVVSLQLILEIAFITHSLSPLSHIQRVALHVTSSVSEIHQPYCEGFCSCTSLKWLQLFNSGTISSISCGQFEPTVRILTISIYLCFHACLFNQTGIRCMYIKCPLKIVENKYCGYIVESFSAFQWFIRGSQLFVTN